MADSSAPQRPTIRTVAERAGVSKSLVSLVLRGSPHVSEAKRVAVEEAIIALEYRRNGSARNLSEKRSNLVGIVLNDLRNPWFVDCLEGITSVLHANGMRMLLADGRLDQKIDDSLVEGFLELQVDGLVLLGTLPTSPTVSFAATHVPTVVAASRDVHLPNVDVIANNDSIGAALAVSHLIQLGHTRIAHLAGSFGAVAELRRSSYVANMKAHGLAEFIAIELCDMTEEGGYRGAVRLLSAPEPPTAIFAANDVSCIGAMSAALELGLRIPRDLSLVGYDNTSLAQLRHLWLTSVDTGSFEVGRLAATALLRRIQRPSDEGEEILIAPRLQVRGTTSPPA